MRKRAMTLTLILAFLFASSVIGTMFVYSGNANVYPILGPTPDDAETPNLTVLSPTNNTAYNPNSLQLSFNVTTTDLPLYFIWYKTDWQQNTTHVYNLYTTRDTLYQISYIENLTKIPEGNHSITITASDHGSSPDQASWWVYFVKSVSSTINFTVDSTSPTISIISIKNKTYTTSDIPLHFAVNEQCSRMSYALDGLENVTVDGNLTLYLPNGNHALTVYATDEVGNVGASETISFSVNAPFPIAFVAAASAASIATIAAGIAVNWKKRKRETES
jgi:hypothetical protein